MTKDLSSHQFTCLTLGTSIFVDVKPKAEEKFRTVVTLSNYILKKLLPLPLSAEDKKDWSYAFVFHTPSSCAQGQPYFQTNNPFKSTRTCPRSIIICTFRTL